MDLSKLTIHDHMELKKEQKALNRLSKEKSNLDMDCISMLELLLEKKESTITELHEDIGLCRTSVGIKLNLLKDRELITKEKSPLDRRTYIIKLENESKVQDILKKTRKTIQTRSIFLF